MCLSAGVNNDFLIRTLSPLAIRYNDCRVLENHHCAAAFEIMIEDDELFQFKVLPHSSELRNHPPLGPETAARQQGIAC